MIRAGRIAARPGVCQLSTISVAPCITLPTCLLVLAVVLIYNRLWSRSCSKKKKCRNNMSKTACQYAMPIQHTVTLTVTVSATATVTLTVTVTVCVSVCLSRIQLHHLQHHHLLHHLWHHCPQHEFFLFCGRALVVLVLHILLHSLAPLSRLVLLCIFTFCRATAAQT